MKTDSGVELITTREGYIRRILATSRYCQTFTIEDCAKSASAQGLQASDLPSIVAELNSRRADLDVQARMCYHAHHSNTANQKTTLPPPPRFHLKTLILSPIRALRRLLRRLEESTRP